MSQPEPVPSPARTAVSEAGRRRDPEQTRDRLLDAAEHLFAKRGFDGTSLRAVTRAAGTSVSAANYHFGSKRALLVETLRRRTEPITLARSERLARLERAAAGEPVPLEALLDAFLRPLFEFRAAQGDGAETFRRVAARLFSDPPHVVADLKRELFGPTAERFSSALARSLPGHSPEHIALGLQFLVGVMVHVASGHLEDAPTPGPLTSLAQLPDAAVLEDMIRFVAAGLRALGAPAQGDRS